MVTQNDIDGDIIVSLTGPIFGRNVVCPGQDEEGKDMEVDEVFWLKSFGQKLDPFDHVCPRPIPVFV